MDIMMLNYLQEFITNIHREMDTFYLGNIVNRIEKFIGQLSRTYLNMNKSRLKSLLTEKDALEAHLRDELGQHPHTKARPVQAAVASAISFTAGGLVPFAGALAPTLGTKVMSIIGFTLVGLVGTGVLSARTAGSPYGKTTLRILIGGSLGMAITAGIGSLVHLTGI